MHTPLPDLNSSSSDKCSILSSLSYPTYNKTVVMTTCNSGNVCIHAMVVMTTNNRGNDSLAQISQIKLV